MTKRLITLTIVTLSIFINILSAKEFDVKGALKAYSQNLDSKSSGVVESSLMYITKLKIEYPEENYKSAVSKINTILSKNPDLTLEYKLYLTKMILSKSSVSLSESILPDTFEPNKFFINISEKMLSGYEVSHNNSF